MQQDPSIDNQVFAKKEPTVEEEGKGNEGKQEMIFDDIMNNSYLQDQMEELRLDKELDLELKQQMNRNARRSNRQSCVVTGDSESLVVHQKLTNSDDIFEDMLDNSYLQEQMVELNIKKMKEYVDKDLKKN